MASSVGQKEALAVFRSLIWLIVVVVLRAGLQVTWYLVQMLGPRRDVAGAVPRRGPRRHGQHVQHGQHGRDDPDHAASPRPRLGISRRSSQLTACIGTNFNNDGTALYQATAVLFIAQALGFDARAWSTR